MSTTRRGKEKEKCTAAATLQPEIQSYFPGTRSASLRNRMTGAQSASYSEAVMAALLASTPVVATEAICASIIQQTTQEERQQVGALIPTV